MKGYLIAFILLAAGIVTVGYIHVRNHFKKSLHEARENLKAISELKSSQIEKWHRERLEHANYFFENHSVELNLPSYFMNPSDNEMRKRIQSVLDSARKNFHYSRLLLFDMHKKLVASAPEGEVWFGPTAESFLDKCCKHKTIMVSDLHESMVKPGFVNMDIFVPLMYAGAAEESPDGISGILMMEINPEEFLFPLIQAWPTPSKTAETLLVRRDGDEIVFLNELRHRKGTALKLRFPIAPERMLLAAMVVSGARGIVEGIDYRGVSVIAHVQDVPGTPWFIVAKLDKEEIYGPIRKEASISLSLILVMIMAGGLGVGFLWKQNDARWLRETHDELELKVRERTEELQAVNRELEAFSYSVSHDLKAPLRSIDGFAKIIEEDYAEKLDDEGRRLLKIIRDSAQDMGHLINDLLDFSRLSRKELHKSAIDMNGLVGEIVSKLESESAGRNIRMEVGPLPEAHGDPSMIREALLNLLSNAFKFTRTRDPSVIQVEGAARNGQYVFTVSDNGVGYDMSYKDKLFCVFQRLHSAAEFEGTGIGLALVQRIIQRHGGKVWSEGELNKGASFHFSLPLAGGH